MLVALAGMSNKMNMRLSLVFTMIFSERRGRIWMLAIHPSHRKLAWITAMCQDKDGNLIMGMAELRSIILLLKQNLEFVWKVDALKNLGLEAQANGQMEWVQEIEAKLEELEVTMT